ncbi:MAG: PAS domain-containing protein [Lachnospiraceae bacterium]|nr:PAS domain-containing protein [Lachnospiraceae bacterium]
METTSVNKTGKEEFSNISDRIRAYRKVTRFLSFAPSMEEGIFEILDYMGRVLDVNRIYLFETDEGTDDLCSNTFEWCSEGTKSHKSIRQHCSYTRYRIREIMGTDHFLFCNDARTLEEPFRTHIMEQGIQSLMLYTFFNDGQLAGFLGIDDNLHVDPAWMQNDEMKDMVSFLADTISLFLIKERNLQRAKYNAEQNEEYLKLMNELTNAGTWYIYMNETGRHTNVHFSDSFRHLLGFADETEFPDTLTSWTNQVHPDDFDMVMRAIREGLVNNSKDYEIKYRMKRKLGNYEWFSVRGKRLTTVDGNPRMVFGTLVNVMERETEMADMNGRLNAMLGGVNGGMKISYNRSKYPYAYISESVAAIQGYTPEEMMEVSGGTAVGNGHPEDIAEIAEQMKRDFLNTGTYSAKYRVRHKDGRWIWIRDYGTLVKSPRGEEFVYSLIQNIDQEERLKTQLETERKAYKDALMNGSMMHYVVDLTEGLLCDEITYNGTVTLHADPSVIRRSSIDEQLAFAKSRGVVVLGAPSEDVFSRESILRCFEQGQTQLEFHAYDAMDDIYTKILVLIHKNDENGHVYATYIHTDETRQQKEQAESRRLLEEAVASAREASNAKSVFLRSMSHDIRTPMNAVMGFTSLALDNMDDKEKVKEYLNKIGGSAQHMLSLMNDILEMSRYEYGQVKLEESVVSLPELLKATCSMIETDAGQKQLHLEIEDSGLADSSVLCDSARLRQILLNCLTNAVKYTPEGGTIHVEASAWEEQEQGCVLCRFRIRDTGIGMSKEFLSHIFEPFTRETSSTVSGISGTGLGMSITRKMVELMGGTIRVTSESGKGTEFIIDIPMKPVPGQMLAEDPASYCKQNHILEGLNILLVEDNELNREIATELLQKKGALVTAVINGLEAVRLVQSTPAGSFDLILMDLQMPVMDGYEATACIRAMEDPARASVPIVALSANAFHEDLQKSADIGFNGHVPKPLNMDILTSVIRQVLKDNRNDG